MLLRKHFKIRTKTFKMHPKTNQSSFEFQISAYENKPTGKFSNSEAGVSDAFTSGHKSDARGTAPHCRSTSLGEPTSYLLTCAQHNPIIPTTHFIIHRRFYLDTYKCYHTNTVMYLTPSLK